MERKIHLTSKGVLILLVAFMFGLIWTSEGWAPGTPPPPPEAECRVTFGGVDTSNMWDGSFADGSSRNGNGPMDRYTFGGQAGSPTGEQPQPWGEITHHQQRGPSGRFVFHAGTASAPEGTEIDYIECSDPGTCTPSGMPPSPNKQIDFGGVGTFRSIRSEPIAAAGAIAGETFHWFDVHMEDLGEPGKSGKQEPPSNDCPPEGSAGDLANCDCPDFYQITIYAGVDPAVDPVIYMVRGYIKGGNIQMHEPH